jgi:hypothetical protein
MHELLVHMLRQAEQVAPLKRSRPFSPDGEPQPQPLSSGALDMAVWEEHLMPLLTCKDAARLGCTCKALRGGVRELCKNLGWIVVENLQAALTTFPRARSLALDKPQRVFNDAREQQLVPWLREGGRGRGIERIKTEEYGEDFVHKALQGGALPSLKTLSASLKYPLHRASLMGGLVAAVHELRLTIELMDDDARTGPQLAALALVRQLPALTKLVVSVHVYYTHDDVAVKWPHFIPPSLKMLDIQFPYDDMWANMSLLRALPGMLGASGAKLDRLEMLLPWEFGDLDDGLVHVAQALRCCSPTLKDFNLRIRNSCYLDADEGVADYAVLVERLRVQWAELLAGVSACRELQVLVLPRINVEPLFPPGTAFGRLTHLEISDRERAHPPDAGEMGLWELMASGGLPALAKLGLRLSCRWVGVEEVRTRVATALEAVAGTLTRLHLDTFILMLGLATRWVWVTIWGWRWASCGGSTTSSFPLPTMAALLTPWPRAWPPVGGGALSPCCGGCWCLVEL